MRLLSYLLVLALILPLASCDHGSYKKKNNHCFQVEHDTIDEYLLEAWTSISKEDKTYTIKNGERKVIYLSKSIRKELEDINLSLRIREIESGKKVWKRVKEYFFDDVREGETTGCKTVSVEYGEEQRIRVYYVGITPRPVVVH